MTTTPTPEPASTPRPDPRNYKGDGSTSDYIADVGEYADRLERANAALAARVAVLEQRSELYFDLIYCVGQKHEGETRHETAKRYILERETIVNSPASEAGQPTTERAT